MMGNISPCGMMVINGFNPDVGNNPGLWANKLWIPILGSGEFEIIFLLIFTQLLINYFYQNSINSAKFYQFVYLFKNRKNIARFLVE